MSLSGERAGRQWILEARSSVVDSWSNYEILFKIFFFWRGEAGGRGGQKAERRASRPPSTRLGPRVPLADSVSASLLRCLTGWSRFLNCHICPPAVSLRRKAVFSSSSLSSSGDVGGGGGGWGCSAHTGSSQALRIPGCPFGSLVRAAQSQGHSRRWTPGRSASNFLPRQKKKVRTAFHSSMLLCNLKAFTISYLFFFFLKN